MVQAFVCPEVFFVSTLTLLNSDRSNLPNHEAVSGPRRPARFPSDSTLPDANHGPDAEHASQAKTGDDELAAYIAATVATIPPLTADERQRIGAIFQGSDRHA